VRLGVAPETAGVGGGVGVGVGVGVEVGVGVITLEGTAVVDGGGAPLSRRPVPAVRSLAFGFPHSRHLGASAGIGEKQPVQVIRPELPTETLRVGF